ncbi:MAG: Trk system potassium transporter TrkA [Thermoanaerobaculia bacterium]|nr:Trk system potassium transporter TrkA [Thermoanaerobaculia bacterium]
MQNQRFVVMGAGEVGFHLARALSREGHQVTVVENDPDQKQRVDDELDVSSVLGNGAHPPVLERAEVGRCDLFMAVSSNDEANLVGALVAKHLGAARTVVRVGIAEEVIEDRRLYEELFGVDMLLSTQLLTTTRILNQIRGHNTVAVEYLAGGRVQLRKIHLSDESILTRDPLRQVELPQDTLVVAFFRGDKLIIPGGEDRAEPGDDALLLGTSEAISAADRLITGGQETALGTVVIAGGGATGRTVARALAPFDVEVKILERDRRRAEELAAAFPRYRILRGDMTDLAFLKSERIDRATTFAALSGNDESNLMACLLAQELEVPEVLALVQRAETTQLWRRLQFREVFAPRALAYERIREYIESGYRSNIVALKRGAAQVVERRLAPASPAAGVTLAEMKPPRGLIVGAVQRGERVFVPRGRDRLEVGDLVILFVRDEELDTVRLLFPGRERQ